MKKKAIKLDQVLPLAKEGVAKLYDEQLETIAGGQGGNVFTCTHDPSCFPPPVAPPRETPAGY